MKKMSSIKEIIVKIDNVKASIDEEFTKAVNEKEIY